MHNFFSLYIKRNNTTVISNVTKKRKGNKGFDIPPCAMTINHHLHHMYHYPMIKTCRKSEHQNNTYMDLVRTQAVKEFTREPNFYYTYTHTSSDTHTSILGTTRNHTKITKIMPTLQQSEKNKFQLNFILFATNIFEMKCK